MSWFSTCMQDNPLAKAFIISTYMRTTHGITIITIDETDISIGETDISRR